MSASHIDAERLVDIVAARANRSDVEAAHLAECVDCRLELDMLGAAGRLGTARLSGFDAGRVAARVRDRLAGEADHAPNSRRAVRWLAGLAAAALLVLAVRLGGPSGRGGPVPASPGAPAEVSVLHELDGLSEPQLEEVLASIPPSTEALDRVELAPLTDLNTTDLELVLRSMEAP